MFNIDNVFKHIIIFWRCLGECSQKKKKKNDDDIATLSAVSKATSKKYLDDTGLGHLSSLIISFVRNYASPKTHNHDGVYAKSSHAHTTSQVTGLDSALAGKADKGHTHDDRYYTESEANSKFSPIGGSASLNKLSENVTLGNGSAGSIVQNSGTYHQKFEILADANAGTDTFVFSQSTDSGAKFTKLMSIRDDGNVVANKFTGALSGNAASASSVPWSGVAGKPSSFTPSSHTHDDRYYTESEVDSKLAGKAPSSHTHTIGNITNLQSSLDGKAAVSHGHSAATTSAAGFMSAADKSKLDGVATGANKTIVDSSLSSTSVNPVQNKVVNSALAGKASTSHTHTTTQVSGLDAALAGKASASHKHDAGDITSGILPIGRGGTGGTSATAANYNILSGIPASRIDAADTDKFVVMHTSPTTSTGRLITKTAAQMWAWIKSKTDPLYATRTHNHDSAYAAKSHNHDAGNITSGVLPIGRGGTGAGTADAALKNLMDNCTIGGMAAPSDDLWYFTSNLDAAQPPVKRKHSALWSYIKSKTDPLYQPRGSYAASSHTHSIANITNLQTELDKKQVKQTPITTSGTGSAYTATVSHIKVLTAGATFTMIPNVVSTTVSPTLNVNGLGAKQLRQRLSNSTQSTATGATANWLAAGKPVNVMYDGAFWVVDFVRPNMTSADGTLPVANGGTGCTNSSDAASHLIDSLAVGATTATDNDYLICQVPNSGTAHKRPMSVVWNWVKAKCDSIYQPKGSYAASSHTHNSIKDIGDGRDITFNCSADGAQDASWFAVWNGSELKSMSKQQMKTSLGISSSGVNLGKLMYPVGAVYISWSSTSPASLFGGSWVAITGRFPYFNAGTSTGGNNTHTLTGGQIPEHSHNVSHNFTVSGNGGSGASGIPGGQPSWGANGANTGWNTPADWFHVGGVYGSFGGSHNNMPAYQTLYAWRRTA